MLPLSGALYIIIFSAARTIADNFVILAAVNNVTIIESAAESKRIQSLSFLEFFRNGAILTVVNIMIYHIFIVFVFT
jgi:Na+/H+ antiporter NhaD/arsenite permease-like protein